MYLVIEKSFREVALSWNGPGREAGHFVPFRDCPGQSGTSGHPRWWGNKNMISLQNTWLRIQY